MVARQRWRSENPPEIVQSLDADLRQVESGSSVSPLMRTQGDRVAEVLAQLKNVHGDSGENLPQAIRSWMMGSAAQLSLVDLWHAWTDVIKVGGRQLVLDKEQVERLVPPHLRINRKPGGSS